ncbi:MAG: C10 family peptidase, partial [Bacteroidales bacterium]|nr:C10 family peptidase [Bacteroidales bacterium]
MKKLFMLAVAVIIGLGAAFANPVDVNTAKSLGQMFVQANFEQTRNADLQLYYTVTSDNGTPCAYVFNLGNEGFVIVAASDNVRPILGYSKNGPFDATNPYNGAMYMLETYKNSITYAIEKNIAATPDIVGEWTSLRNCGKLNNKKGKSVDALVWTRWNQNSPYNLYAPPTQGGHQGAGGRCYAGCVATAMGQLMKYWDHPITGESDHGYNCIGYGPTYYNYGYQYANFGETTYQWDLMPRSLNNASQEEIEAVATLLYHCGVATDMTFDWDGSGTYSDIVPGAMADYFDYDHCEKKNRNSYSLANWISMLKAEFDLGRPVYYSGQGSEGGHAFVCDGYDENDLMHFNFGWSGSDDDYYAVDAIEYSSQAAAIFNFVPTYVYDNTVQAPTNVTAVKTSDLAQEATITWTNPTQTLTNQNVSSLDQMVVTRDGKVIYTVDNPTPGAAMSFVDSDVPCYSTFEYKVYAVYNGVNGAGATATESFGPTCEWKVIGTTTNMAGWKSAYVIAYDAAGREIDRFTMTSSNPTTYNMNMTIGKVSFAWKAGTDNVAITIKIKDSTGAIVYQYDGNSNDVPEGVL